MIGNIFGIEKLRVNDGPGITTLVGMYKCPLNCEYCLNNPITVYRKYTIEELFNEVFPHALYYESTGGGICFGGHEPLLQQPFIKEFIKYVKNQNLIWKFGLETSLNTIIDPELILMVDYLIIDIKDINPEIYKKYTEKDNHLVLDNLKLLRTYKNVDIKIRLPYISNYNTEEDILKSKEYLKNIGYSEKQFNIFTYKTKED